MSLIRSIPCDSRSLGLAALASTALVLVLSGVTSGRPQAAPPQFERLDSRKPISSLPFTIDRCGSYVVTRCLTGQSGLDGITISAASVTLDLDGYTLTGVPGSLSGITVTVPGTVTIKSGHVRNWGEHGVTATIAATTLTVSDLHTSGNGFAGINLGRGLVERCSATGNTTGGFSVGGTGIGAVALRDCRAEGCPLGFSLRGAADAVGCSAFGNPIGFRASDGVSLRACTALGNTVGIQLDSSGATIRDCVAAGNGTGIHIDGASGNRIESNTLSANTLALLADGGATDNLIVGNSTHGNATSYLIDPGNPHGPIVSVVGAGDIASVVGAEHPRANLEH